MSPSPLLANATLALSVLASILVQLSLADRQGSIWPSLTQLLMAAAVAGLIGWCDQSERANRKWVFGFGFTALISIPFVADTITRSCFSYGSPYEVLMASVLLNLMLGLAMIRSDHRAQGLACLSSLFLVLFAFLLTMNTATVTLLVLYCVLGMWWLLGAYWDRLSDRMADHSERAAPLGPTSAAIAIGLIGLLVAAPLARSSRFTTALNGFMPSSGGTSWTDENAIGGLGDGDQLVKGKEDASSFGPIDSDLFLESEMPSLYDVFNELGEPAKPKKNGRKRAIALSPQQMQQNHKHRGKMEQAGREFEAVRRPPKNIDPAQDRKSDALLHITGRVPVHLGLEAFDQWDGRTLSQSKASARVAVKLDNLPDQNGDRWVRPSRSLPKELFTYADFRAVKFINLKSSTVPSPPQTDALLLDEANNVALFDTTEQGDLKLDIAFIPQLTTLYLRSWVRPIDATPTLSQSTPSEVSKRLEQLARDWTKGVAPGWAQAEAICERLQSDYVHDRLAVAPEDVDDAVEHFLFVSKRGPDYLFATSAAVLLRTLGYESRVRSGFYPQASNFNVLARSTPVYAEDAHFWTEVLCQQGMSFTPEGETRRGTWITLEPTPGYEVLFEPPSYWMMAKRMVGTAWQAIAERPLQSTILFACFATVVWLRAAIADRLITLWWLFVSRLGDARHTTRSTLRLLRRRAWLRGYSMTGAIGRWNLFPRRETEWSQKLTHEFGEIASWAIYGEDTEASTSKEQIRQVCGQMARKALRPAAPLPIRMITKSNANTR